MALAAHSGTEEVMGAIGDLRRIERRNRAVVSVIVTIAAIVLLVVF